MKPLREIETPNREQGGKINHVEPWSDECKQTRNNLKILVGNINVNKFNKGISGKAG